MGQYTMEQLIMLNRALDAVLNVAGFPIKVVYGFDKNKKKILPIIEDWVKEMHENMPEVWIESSEDISFVSPQAYQTMKKDILGAISQDAPRDIIITTIEEVLIKGHAPIEIDLHKVFIDERTEPILQRFPGSVLTALSPILIINEAGLILAKG